jgi:hypothetical protein
MLMVLLSLYGFQVKVENVELNLVFLISYLPLQLPLTIRVINDINILMKIQFHILPVTLKLYLA